MPTQPLSNVSDGECIELMHSVAHPKVLSMIVILVDMASVNLNPSLIVNITPGASVGTSILCHSGKPQENISIVSLRISCEPKP